MSELTLEVDRILEEAVATTGLDDFGEPSWEAPLGLLVDSLRDEGQLNEIGVQIATGELVGYLTTRLRLLDWQRREPAAARADVVPPIVIMGQGRTGTTILHDLLAEDPATRVPLTWEVDRPFPPPESATYDTDPRIAEVDELLSGTELLIPGFQAIHPMGARLPQECVRITGCDFRSMIFPTQYRVPSYGAWLIDEADMASAYRLHRVFLQVLQSKHRAERWVLKSPGHVWCIDALLAEYPNAVLVQTHRDPLQIIASLGSLVPHLRRLASDDPSQPEAAAEFAEYIVEGLDRSVTAREDGTVSPDRVVDVHFRSFLADPFATIASIYEEVGIEFTGDAEKRMRAFLDEHPRDKHGTHDYTWAATGLDEAEWRARTERYQSYFGVPSESLP